MARLTPPFSRLSRLSSRRQGYLMKQGKLSSRWKPFYFRLDNGYLACYEKKSLVGTSPSKGMQLTATSTASYATLKNCLCVRTGDVAWFLMAKSPESLYEWLTAVNAEIHA
ncbi:unnamed protein product, partial [Hapterophycus canaliculatus]